VGGAEPAEHQQRQRDYIARLKTQDHIWYEFDTREQLLTLLEKTRFHNLVKPNLPFDSIGTLFKGREDELKAVRKSLLTRPAHATAVTSKQAIHGLGGVGKTRFAVEYAHRYGTEYSARLYANADTPSALTSNMAALVHVLDLPEKEEKEQPKQLEAVERWLRMHAGWLLILDNVDTAEAQSAVNAVFPNLTTGHVLITSRLTDWGTGVNAVELDVLSLPASTEFLLERTERKAETPTAPARQLTDTDPDEAESLAEELGRLALALEQAGAYICANRITFAEYRRRLTEVEREVLTWFDPAVMKYPKSVAVTWQASVRKLHDEGRNLLNLLCWLAPDPIPVALIKTEPKEPPHFPIDDRERALRDLSAYSLAKWNASGDAVTVHRLVQDVTRTRLAELKRTEVLKDSLSVMVAFCVGDPQDPRTWKSVYRPASAHVLPLTQVGVAMRICSPTSRLANEVGVFFKACADYGPSEVLLRRAVALDEIDREMSHPTGTHALNNLAALLDETNRIGEAESLLARALELNVAMHGPDHESVAVTLNNLAELFEATDRRAEAEQSLRRALVIYESTSGTSTPEVATVLTNLARVLHDTNQLSEAEALFRRALTIDEACFGREHPHVARHLNNLAGLLSETNRHAEAESLFRRALAIDEVNFGPEHPATANRLSNLAGLLLETNRHAEAERLYERTLAICEACFGPQHPEVARIVNNLLAETGRLTQAEPMARRALAIYESSFGPTHSNVAFALNNLAHLFAGTKPAEAELLYRRALAIRETSHGPNHPNVASALGNLATVLFQTGRHDEAESLTRRALAIDEASYGSTHSAVAIRLNNLAAILKAANRLPEATNLLRRVLHVSEAIFGSEHPRVALALNNLAVLLRALNRLDEADPLYERGIKILAAFRQATGHPHPHFPAAINNYGEFLERSRGYTKEQTHTRILTILGLK